MHPFCPTPGPFTCTWPLGLCTGHTLKGQCGGVLREMRLCPHRRPIQGVGKPHVSGFQGGSAALAPQTQLPWEVVGAGLRGERGFPLSSSLQRPPSPVKGGEGAVVPAPGPGTPRGHWEVAWEWGTSWESGLSHHLHPMLTALAHENRKPFRGEAGSRAHSPVLTRV